MASAPPNNLPIFYKDLMPLNSRDHSTWRARPATKAPWVAGVHAVPLTVEEFPQAARHYPIIFATGENPVPLALMGLNENVNVFVEADGTVKDGVYMPAYARRYPFLLAKLSPDTDELSLCFDPTTDLIGEYEDGEPLFVDGQPSDVTKGALQFCENFEQAGFRTQQFIEDVTKADLLMDGEVSIQQPGVEQPFVYRGFKMINQEKLRDMRGDQLRTWAQNGLLPLLYAHIFSLDLISTVFGMQQQQGKGPAPAIIAPATA